MSAEGRNPLNDMAEFIGSQGSSDVYLYIGSINKSGYNAIFQHCHRINKRKNIFLTLITYGGDPHAAYQIARCVKRSYEKVTILVAGPCKSAGTLITVVADSLIIGDRGELGPLDIQVRKTGELFHMSSGLDTIEALNQLRTQAQETFKTSLLDMNGNGGFSTVMAADIATKLTIGLFSPIFAQIDPHTLGERQRAINIVYDYGERLGGKSLKPGALGTLVAGYPSHGFTIDREEAAQLFHTLRPASQVEAAFADMVTEGLTPQLINEGPQVILINGATDADNDVQADDQQEGTPRAGAGSDESVEPGGRPGKGDGEGAQIPPSTSGPVDRRGAKRASRKEDAILIPTPTGSSDI